MSVADERISGCIGHGRRIKALLIRHCRVSTSSAPFLFFYTFSVILENASFNEIATLSTPAKDLFVSAS